MAVGTPGAEIVAIGTVKRAAAVKIRTRLIQTGLSPYMHTWDVWKSVAVMTGRRPVTIAAVQRMTGVTHVSIRYKLLMSIRPVDPVGGGFAPGGIKVALSTPGAEVMAVGTVQRAGAVEIRASLVQPVITGDVSVRQTMAVMAAPGPVSIAAVQVMTGVAH